MLGQIVCLGIHVDLTEVFAPDAQQLHHLVGGHGGGSAAATEKTQLLGRTRSLCLTPLKLIYLF